MWHPRLAQHRVTPPDGWEKRTFSIPCRRSSWKAKGADFHGPAAAKGKPVDGLPAREHLFPLMAVSIEWRSLLVSRKDFTRRRKASRRSVVGASQPVPSAIPPVDSKRTHGRDSNLQSFPLDRNKRAQFSRKRGWPVYRATASGSSSIPRPGASGIASMPCWSSFQGVVGRQSMNGDPVRYST